MVNQAPPTQSPTEIFLNVHIYIHIYIHTCNKYIYIQRERVVCKYKSINGREERLKDTLVQ